MAMEDTAALATLAGACPCACDAISRGLLRHVNVDGRWPVAGPPAHAPHSSAADRLVSPVVLAFASSDLVNLACTPTAKNKVALRCRGTSLA